MTPKQLIVVAGPPCSGKSTLANAIAQLLSIPHFDIDSVAKETYPDEAWSEKTRDLAYNMMYECSLGALEASSVIMVATFGRDEKRMELVHRVGQCNARMSLVQCKVSPSTAVQRFQQRQSNHPAIDLTETRVRNLAECYRYCSEGLILDCESPILESLSKVQNHLMAGLTSDVKIPRNWVERL